MKIAVASLLLCCAIAGHAQVPHVIGTWELNVAASRLPGPPPRTHVRSYRLTDDGFVIGVAVVVDAAGRPSFLQFAAKPDGRDYPEFDTGSAARYLIDETKPVATYAETPIDSHTVEWVDKTQGRTTFAGRKWVSADGQTLTFTAVTRNERGEDVEFLFVFDRTGD